MQVYDLASVRVSECMSERVCMYAIVQIYE